MKPDIEIICPSCSQKAAFFSPTTVRFMKVVPQLDGKVVCTSCGFNKEHHFTPKDYWYAIPIGKRVLYARTMENLKSLLVYFKENKRLNEEPRMDFPKEFYKNRLTLVNKIEKRIQQEES